MDNITITDLRVPTLIGVHAHERTAPQDLLITTTLLLSIDQPAKTDCIDDALDYTQVRQAILDFAKQSDYQLLESFSSDLADDLKRQFQVSGVELIVTKFPSDMPDIGGVTLRIFR